MIVDTSALIAVPQKEEGYERIEAILAGSGRLRIVADTSVEAMTVAVGRRGEAGKEAIEETDAEFAAVACARYGEGTGCKNRPDPAKLMNLGDCFAYALAERTGVPLSCTGNDFAATDISLVPLVQGS